MLEVYHQFKILGLTVDASLDEINKSYKKKAKLYHPDTSDEIDANEKFIKLKNAKNEATKFKGEINKDKHIYLKSWIKRIKYYYDLNKISMNVYELLKRNALCLKYSYSDMNQIDKHLDLLLKGLIDETDFLRLIKK